jgi:GNAT superfamily N-acetyltransferase
MEKIIVRKATLQDIPAIHQLVYELAVYEKAPEAHTATVTDYKRDFEAQIFEACVAQKADSGEIVGMILYYMAYSTWRGRMLYLEDFVVTETFRQYGIGKLLFDKFLEIAAEKGCQLTKWQVLDWNTPALKFYEKQEAIIEKEWYNGKIFINKALLN